VSARAESDAPEPRSRAAPRAAAPFAFVAILVWLALAALDGGYWPSAWGPLGLFLLGAVVLATLLLPSDAVSREPARRIALLLLVLFLAWCFASMTWADFPADAWAGTNKTLLYALGLVLFLPRYWEPRTLRVALLAFVLGVAALGAATLGTALLPGRAEAAFADGRLLPPTGYVNATVALWTMGFWIAVHLAAHPRASASLRALLIAAAALLLQLALLGQSRAWLALLPVTAAVALLLAPRRLRLLGAVTTAGVASACAAPILLDVREAVLAGALEPALRRAAVATVLAAAAAAAVGALWARLERRLRPDERLVRRAGVALAVVAAAGAVAGGVGAALAIDDPGDWVASRWQDFTGGAYPQDERFGGSLASNRYQHWRIAWEEFRDRPVAGAGVDNYHAGYLLRRTSPDAEPRYPHSWALRLLAQTGLVGTLLFLGAAGAVLALALRVRRQLGPDDGTLAAAGVMVFAYWLLHGAVDWFWEIPALAAPALGLLGLTAATRATPAPVSVPQAPRRAAVALAMLALAVAATVSLALPWLAYLQQRAGLAVWRSDRALAYARLDRAASLNPLAGEPLLLKGTIALRGGDAPVAAAALERVVEREPKSWYGWFQLALAAAVEGDDRRAAKYIELARTLNPLDPLVAEAAASIAAGLPLDPNHFDERFRARAELRTGTPRP
jgi:tetratricopeptide (TPR) repeat protein